MSEKKKKKSKFKVKPYVRASSYKSTPVKDVEVEGMAGDYGIEAEANLGKGFKLSGRRGSSFDKGKVNYPGGSESWDADIPGNWNAKVEWSAKFSRGGGIAIQGTKFRGVK